MRTMLFAFVLAISLWGCSKKPSVQELREKAYAVAYIAIAAREELTLCNVPDLPKNNTASVIVEPTMSNDGSWRAEIHVTNCSNGKSAITRQALEWDEAKGEFATSSLGVLIQWVE
jgi:hypothetical protein